LLVLTEGSIEYILEGYTVSQLRKMLAQGPVVISFRKVSTEKDRIMYCTRRMDMIPGSKHPKGGPSRIPPGNLAVYDLIKKDWRSFRVNRVLKAKEKRLSFLTRALRRRKFKKDHEPGTSELELQPNDTHPDDRDDETNAAIRAQDAGPEDDVPSLDDEDENVEENLQENYLQTAKSIVLYEIDRGFKGFYNA